MEHLFYFIAHETTSLERFQQYTLLQGQLKVQLNCANYIWHVRSELGYTKGLYGNSESLFDVLTDVGKIHSSYDKLHGAGSHERMTDSEFRLLRLHPNLDATELSKLLGIARIYDVSAQRQRIIHELEVTKHKERLLG